MYRITTATPEDLTHLPGIELAAARLLVGHAPESVLAETTSREVLARAQRDGHLWVARNGHGPVGFAHVVVLEPDSVHLEEVDVHPAHGRQGLGTRLVRHVCDWAEQIGYASVTLTTFSDVPWNMPFYERFGFTVVAPNDRSAALRAIVRAETRRGLDPRRRVVMTRAAYVPVGRGAFNTTTIMLSGVPCAGGPAC